MGRTTFYDYFRSPVERLPREFTGVEINARKRLPNGWQLYASYLWSELEGNYDGVFQASTGQLDPNINSAFDYADFFLNADGKLSNDREHSVKINGSYTFQNDTVDGLNVGISAYWRSGTPLTAYGYSFGYSNWEYYLTPRGSLGRNPDDYEINLHVDYPFKFGNGREISLIRRRVQRAQPPVAHHSTTSATTSSPHGAPASPTTSATATAACSTTARASPRSASSPIPS